MLLKKHIPNFLTCCNLGCGCVGVVCTINGQLESATYLIWGAMLFDFLDGFVARLLRAYSAIGKELDSLADMVTFGVLPGILSYQLLTELETPGWLPYLGFLITIFSALRLAKFNVDDRQQNAFIGLPTPANALFISSLVLMDWPWLTYPILLTIVVLFSFLLIAPLELFALKFKQFGWKGNEIRYIFLILSASCIIILQFRALPIIIVSYICLSFLKNVLSTK